MTKATFRRDTDPTITLRREDGEPLHGYIDESKFLLGVVEVGLKDDGSLKLPALEPLEPGLTWTYLRRESAYSVVEVERPEAEVKAGQIEFELGLEEEGGERQKLAKFSNYRDNIAHAYLVHYHERRVLSEALAHATTDSGDERVAAEKLALMARFDPLLQDILVRNFRTKLIKKHTTKKVVTNKRGDEEEVLDYPDMAVANQCADVFRGRLRALDNLRDEDKAELVAFALWARSCADLSLSVLDHRIRNINRYIDEQTSLTAVRANPDKFRVPVSEISAEDRWERERRGLDYVEFCDLSPPALAKKRELLKAFAKHAVRKSAEASSTKKQEAARRRREQAERANYLDRQQAIAVDDPWPPRKAPF